MKKIISTLIISALALGSVFADISLAYTQKSLISTNDGGKSKKLDLNGYKEKTTSDVVFKLTNDVAGVVLDIDPFYKETGKVAENSTNGYFLDKYYGWVNFADGSFKLQAGKWQDRHVNRMTTDAAKWEGYQYEKYKPGVINGDVAKDIADITGKKLAMQLTYTAESYYVAAAIVTSDFLKKDANKTADILSGFSFEGRYTVDEDTNVTAFLRILKDQQYALGAFLDKKNIEFKERNLNVMGGVSFGSLGSSGSTKNPIEFGVDLRARYQLSDTLFLTTMNNISYNGAKTTEAERGTGCVQIWDMLSLTANVTEALKFTLTGEWDYKDLAEGDAGILVITPAVQYTVGKGAFLQAGVSLTSDGWLHPKSSTVAIPFILNVAL